MKDFIAERRIDFAHKGSEKRKELIIQIGRPEIVDPEKVNFPVTDCTAVCMVEFIGFGKEYLYPTYGADLLQALQLASDVEPTLKRFTDKYDFFFQSGEPYFEE